MEDSALLADVRSAEFQVAEAEQELASLLREIQGVARAEKTTISKTLEAALDKLRLARRQLLLIEERAAANDD
jgi:hypothetical protein